MERSFADLEYETKKRKTRQERFLGRMDALIPWCKLLEEIKPYYPCAEKRRVPYPLESMLRVHCVQLFYNLSDPAMEDMGTPEKARIRHQRTFHFPRRYRISQMPNHGKGDFSEVPMLYEVESVPRCCDISLEKVPDESTILNFRHRLERHGLGRKLFERISEDLAKQGLLLKEGSIPDATIIEAPPSRKNSKRERDGEMKPTKKGKQWHFGMKFYVGVNEESGLIHNLETTSAKCMT